MKLINISPTQAEDHGPVLVRHGTHMIHTYTQSTAVICMHKFHGSFPPNRSKASHRMAISMQVTTMDLSFEPRVSLIPYSQIVTVSV